MSFILLGILNAQAAGVEAGPFDLLETTVLTSSASSVSFTNLNSTYGSTYKHLQLRTVLRYTSGPDGLFSVNIRFNNDSGSNYNTHGLGTDGNIVFSYDNSQSYIALDRASTMGGAPANIFSPAVTDILDPFSTSKNTTIRSLNGAAQGTENRLTFNSGAYFDTAAVDDIELFPATAISVGDFEVGSRFSLYGIGG